MVANKNETFYLVLMFFFFQGIREGTIELYTSGTSLEGTLPKTKTTQP